PTGCKAQLFGMTHLLRAMVPDSDKPRTRDRSKIDNRPAENYLTQAAPRGLPGAKGFCSHGSQSEAGPGTPLSSKKEQRRTETTARFRKNRNDQCESSDGFPDCFRAGPAGQRSGAALA